ncbi:MAG: hypothetical protein JXR63_12455 [Spirochaetales bacterium]|nr:hypothetical protein [Spirochaetales bacterium]
MRVKTFSIITWIASGILFVAMIIVNALASSLRLNGFSTGDISKFYDNIFVPAGFTFSIWGIIYLALIFYVSYSFTVVLSNRAVSQKKNIVNGVLFSLSSVLNGTWLIAWHYQKIVLTMVLMILLLLTLVFLYINSQSIENLRDKIFLNIPISIYLGWVCVATIANFSALLVSYQVDTFLNSQVAWVISFFALAFICACVMLLFKNDTIFSFVVIWAFLGISVGNYLKINEFDIVSASLIVFISVLLALVVVSMYWRKSYYGKR